MKERILDPMQEKRMIESSSSEFGTKMIEKIMRLQEERPRCLREVDGKSYKKENMKKNGQNITIGK